MGNEQEEQSRRREGEKGTEAGEEAAGHLVRPVILLWAPEGEAVLQLLDVHLKSRSGSADDAEISQLFLPPPRSP